MFVAVPPLHVAHPNHWRLAAPLIYFSETYDLSIQVPRGFKTDLASIPIGFRNIIDRNGKHRPAAICHDYLYAVRGELGEDRLSRADCDAIFKEAMECCGVGWFTRQAMWAAVRVGGWISW